MKIIECNLPRNGPYTRRSETTAVVLHHAEASSATVWDINSWHMERDMNGIGYHYYVRKDGSVYRGRPEWALGAHAIGANDWSIGVCCEGAYMTETMPAVQLATLKELLRDIMARNGRLRLLRHKDVSATNCPGDRFPWAEVQDYDEEDNEMVEVKIMYIDGKKYSVHAIEKDGQNYVRLRDLQQADYNVAYDGVPHLFAPLCREHVPALTEENAADVVEVQQAYGFEDSTINYLRQYKYGDALMHKLSARLKAHS